jgi:hypothetical protein
MKNVNIYQRGSEQGVGLIVEWGGIKVHAIAWDSGNVERLPDGQFSLEGVTILLVGPLIDVTRAAQRGKTEEFAPPADAATVEEDSDDLGSKVFDDWKVPADATEAKIIEAFLLDFGTGTTNKDVIAALATKGISVTSPQVTVAKKKLADESAGTEGSEQKTEGDEAKAGE